MVNVYIYNFQNKSKSNEIKMSLSLKKLKKSKDNIPVNHNIKGIKGITLKNNNSVIETNGNKYVPLLTIKPYHLAGPLVIASAMSGLFLSTARTIKVTTIKTIAIPLPISALNFFM